MTVFRTCGNARPPARRFMRGHMTAVLLCATAFVAVVSVVAQGEELKVTGDRFSLVLPSREWQVVTTPSDKAALVVLGPAVRG